MVILQKLNRYFDHRKDYGIIFLRLVIGWRLVDGTQDNIFSWDRMVEFRVFLEQHGVPFPLLAAVLSVWFQFICGILYLVGGLTRVAAMLMIVNFTIALLIVHVGLTFEQSFDALMMLFGSIFFLFYGAGKFSIDESLAGRSKKP